MSLAPAASALRQIVAGAASRLRRQLDDPGAVQAQRLRELIDANAGSPFGIEHGFASIADASDYARRVPVRDYEALWPWIERSTLESRAALTSEPVVAFEETGGSTTGPRLVPYTARGLAEFERGLHAWLDDLFETFPALAQGSHYWSISPACRPARRLPNGIAIGMPGDAAYFGAAAAPHIVASLAVPAEVGAIGDFATWRRQTLVHLLARDDLALISVWSPTFLAALLDFARREPERVVDWLASSGLASTARVARVAAALTQDPPDLGRLWPRLGLVSCWDQAAARGPAAALRRRLVPCPVQGKGLLATEALVTLPLHGHPFPVLALESGYFEFRQADGATRSAATVEDGGEYELVVSNASGLWRYAIGDVVRVRGFAGRTPMVEFLGRNGGSDLCGEKLSAAFVGQALATHGLGFAMLQADAQEQRYVLVVDSTEVGADQAGALAARVEADLAANPQYRYARSLG
ncbi:MAG: GH3 auxin-responsive promoter family protein, partial [Pseudomonadota bacterium]|nr:GH3 auxin-responsive promoter family protein [Pseudomonadota bacterium]